MIVVDDGSTDNSLEKVQKFKSSKVQIIEQKNSGVSIARNNGAKAAKYDYIAFLDADDWWSPTFLEEMKMLVADFPEGALYASSYYRVKNGKNIPARIGVSKDFMQGYFDYCNAYIVSSCMPVWTGAVVIKKEIYKEMQGFKPQLKLAEDFDLWLRIALKYKTVLVNKPLAYYNQDVDIRNRAIGKVYPPETQFAFNTGFLADEEKKNRELKQVIDNVRIRVLRSYYVSKEFHHLAKKELKKVDWTKQENNKAARYVRYPVFYLRIKDAVLSKLSLLKSKIMLYGK
ncbi:hypothetical protein FACS18945_3490 [Bacteroidia bacterium]|nr:hypothetical protein FACS18945_3490 [Bacteroidia bacterium]